MADSADVTATLTSICGALLYPNGTAMPSAANCDAQVFPGWPNHLRQKAALERGISQVSIYPGATERNTTRYLQEWIVTQVNTPTLTLTASGQTVTLSGTIPPVNNPHNAVIFVNHVPYVYAVQPFDTLTTVMAALAVQIGADVQGAFTNGPFITFADGTLVGACRIGVTGTSMLEVSRQEKMYQIIIWSDSPQHRTAIAKILDPQLKRLTFINLPDLTQGRIRYSGNREYDTSQKEGMYRRDLEFTVEYATTVTQTSTQITQEKINVGVGVAGQQINNVSTTWI